MNKNLSLAVRALAVLPGRFKDIKPKHIKEIQDMFKLDNDDISIDEDVDFAMHSYKHYIASSQSR